MTSFNVDFDRPMVERMGLRNLRWASCVMLRCMDVMGPAGALRPARGPQQWLWPKLQHAAEFFRVPIEGTAHRALADARTAARVAVAIRRTELGLEVASG